MCGYIGQISQNQINHEKLLIQNKNIICRGPDEKQHKKGNLSEFNNTSNLNYSFIFNRLSIVDLTANASQPMFSDQFNTSIMFNGEIYNHKTLRESLENENIQFKSKNSDNDILKRSIKPRYKPTDGIEVGKHNGAHFYTIGQRKGLGVGGNVEPLFIIDTDMDNNIIYVGQGKVHPGLYRLALRVSQRDIHWVRDDLSINSGEKLSVDARIRYRQALQKATLFQTKDIMYISFENPQFAITSGQFVAWYREKELIGSGVIS